MKGITLSIISAAVLIGGAIILSGDGTSGADSPIPAEQGIATDGNPQIIDMSARGGYWPRVVRARAGVPALLRMRRYRYLRRQRARAWRAHARWACTALLLISSRRDRGEQARENPASSRVFS
ncbi:MAG: hypothetical protein WC767_03135 [Candidatus Paceibacterota bacterium]